MLRRNIGAKQFQRRGEFAHTTENGYRRVRNRRRGVERRSRRIGEREKRSKEALGRGTAYQVVLLALSRPSFSSSVFYGKNTIGLFHKWDIPPLVSSFSRSGVVNVLVVHNLFRSSFRFAGRKRPRGLKEGRTFAS